jgi:hypothetical protein
MKLGNYAVFLTDQALAELNGVADLWLRSGKFGYYLLCASVSTEGVFTDLEFEDEVVPGNMHLMVHHHYIRAILVGETPESFGFIKEGDDQSAR